MDEKNGKWILVIDNARPNICIQDILPHPVAWGKIIVTSRVEDLGLHFCLTRIKVPLLSSAEALNLFWSKCDPVSHSISEDESSILSYINKMAGRPLAIILAACHIRLLGPAVMIEYFRLLEREQPLTNSGHDSQTSNWVFLIMEELGTTERTILKLLAVFDSRKISDEFIEVLKAPTLTSTGGQQPPDLMKRRIFGNSTRLLMSHQLLCRESSPWDQYYSILPSVQDILNTWLSHDHENLLEVVTAAASMIQTGYEAANISTFQKHQEVMGVLHLHYRSVCRNLHRLGQTSDILKPSILEAAASYYLAQAIHEGTYRCTKQSWHVWLIQNRYPLPEHTNADNDVGEYDLQPPTHPAWLTRQYPIQCNAPNLRNTTIPTSSPLHQSIYDALWRALRDAITLSAIGRAWHGIRDDIFAHIRTCASSRIPADIASIADYVEKGACEGLLAVVVRCIHSTAFQQEAMESLGGDDIIEEISQLIEYAIGRDHVSNGLDIAVAATEALDFLMSDAFHEMAGAFDAVLATVRSRIYTIIDSAIHGSPASFQNVVHFTVEYTSEVLVRNRARAVARGFWEVVGAAEWWLAAAVAVRVAFVLREREQGRSVNNRCAELVREGIIGWQSRSTAGWRLSTRKAMYWCLQAEEAMSGWGAAVGVVPYECQNNEQWEEACILLGITADSWPLS